MIEKPVKTSQKVTENRNCLTLASAKGIIKENGGKNEEDNGTEKENGRRTGTLV